MNKINGEWKGLVNLLKRFEYKMKDGALLVVLGVVVVLAAWLVFHAGEKEVSAPAYATETETKVLRLLQEIDGVGEASVIIYEKEGDIENVVVVCEGANDIRVVMNVREAVSSALGTEQKSVKVYLKKE